MIHYVNILEREFERFGLLKTCREKFDTVRVKLCFLQPCMAGSRTYE
jgi:hypothetical protein